MSAQVPKYTKRPEASRLTCKEQARRHNCEPRVMFKGALPLFSSWPGLPDSCCYAHIWTFGFPGVACWALTAAFKPLFPSLQQEAC